VAAGDPAYAPTLGGTTESFLVRSGESCVQRCPPVVVRQSTFEAKYSARGFTGEKSTGAVRSTR
jgi:hypothetical protein